MKMGRPIYGYAKESKLVIGEKKRKRTAKTFLI